MNPVKRALLCNYMMRFQASSRRLSQALQTRLIWWLT